MRPWKTLDSVPTDEGLLELRQRGEEEFHILVAGRVLMASAAHRSEAELAQAACERIAGRPRPRVLIGGLGMGYTLRAALDALPAAAEVVVAELNPVVVRWCRGRLAGLTSRAVDDPRVTVEVADVAQLIRQVAAAGGPRKEGGRFDAIVLDLYEGPREAYGGASDPFFGDRAVATTRKALTPGGVFAVWSEDPDAPFERRLADHGFEVERRRPKSGGPRHVVYLAS